MFIDFNAVKSSILKPYHRGSYKQYAGEGSMEPQKIDSPHKKFSPLKKFPLPLFVWVLETNKKDAIFTFFDFKSVVLSLYSYTFDV